MYTLRSPDVILFLSKDKEKRGLIKDNLTILHILFNWMAGSADE